MKATGGTRISGILTRQSVRVRSDQEHHRADVVTPHVYDHASGKVVPNPAFVKLYPEHTATYYSEADVKRSGDKKLTQLWDKQAAEHVAHQANLGNNKPVKYTKKDKARISKKIKEL